MSLASPVGPRCFGARSIFEFRQSTASNCGDAQNARVTYCSEGRSDAPRQHVAKLACHVHNLFVRDTRHLRLVQRGSYHGDKGFRQLESYVTRKQFSRKLHCADEALFGLVSIWPIGGDHWQLKLRRKHFGESRCNDPTQFRDRNFRFHCYWSSREPGEWLRASAPGLPPPL